MIGAGGAGLRAAIEASAQGARTALVCKSLLGKAHTVMAEGGIAAALGNVWPEDNWQVHFRDTMRGGKMLNNWRMAQIHAQEAPDRVLELEEWGALFDRTKDGLILQRDFGGHRYARLAHVGDRTGLEMIRTLQQHAVHKGIDVYMECTIQRLLKDGDRVARRLRLLARERASSSLFKAKAVVLATGGIGKAWKVTSNSWEYTGDGIALALDAGADLIDMEMVQFHPTGMVWPPSVRGILVTEGVRGDGGTLQELRRASASCSTTSPSSSGPRRPTPRRRPTPGTRTRRTTAARPICCRATRSRGRSTPRSRPGAARRTAASSSTSPRGAPRTTSSKRLPSMYHQFKELADVDITKEPMEVGPTCHYIMGGVRVDADTDGHDRARAVRRRRGGGGHARRQPPRRQLALRPAGVRPARRPARRRVRRRRSPARSTSAATQVEAARDRDAGAVRARRAARTRTRSTPTAGRACRTLVGIIRTESGAASRRWTRSRRFKQRLERVARRGRPRSTTPAGTWRSTCSRMLTVSEAVTPRRPSSARRAAAATPATTTRHRRRASARSTW